MLTVEITFQRWMILCARDVRATVRSLCLCDTLQQCIRLECRFIYPYNMLFKTCILPFNFEHPVIFSHVLWSAFGVSMYALFVICLETERDFLSCGALYRTSDYSTSSWKRHGRALKSTSRLSCASPTLDTYFLCLYCLLIWLFHSEMKMNVCY